MPFPTPVCRCFINGRGWQRIAMPLVLWAACALLVGQSTAHAEVRLLELSTSYSDFALNPKTGEVAAIDSEQGTVTLFRSAFFDGDKTATSAPVQTGISPSCICYKEFGAQAYFCVACAKDSNMYLLNPADLKLISKISLAGVGIIHLGCSTHPEDPFVYYVGGTDYQRIQGCAVNLRTMTDVGQVLNRCSEAVISPNGRLAYLRSMYSSPTGFDCYRMNSPFDAKTPQFAQTFHEHESVPGYLPDPYDQFTAVGSLIYSADLTKRISAVPYTIALFVQKPALIVGFTSEEVTEKRRGLPPNMKPLELLATSYNSFRATGERIPMPKSFGSELKPSLKPTVNALDPLSVRNKTRYFSDDSHGRIICACLDQFAIVPIIDFKAPDEPLLHATLKSATVLQVGRLAELEVTVRDPRVELTFANLPPQAKVTQNKIAWTPAASQIGQHPFQAVLKHGEFERKIPFSVSVENPKVTLPFVPRGIALSASGKTAVVWSSAIQPPAPPATQLAVVDVAGMKLVASHTEGLTNLQFELDDKYLYLRESRGAFIQVHDLQTLKRVKTLYTDDVIERIFFHEDLLIANSNAGMSAFLLSELRPRKVPVEGPGQLTNLGIIWNDVVLDKNLETPVLLLSSTLPSLGMPVSNSQFDYSRHANMSRGTRFTGEPRHVSNDAQRQFQNPLNPYENQRLAAVDPIFRAEVLSEGGGRIRLVNTEPERIHLSLKDWLRGGEVIRIPIAQHVPSGNPQVIGRESAELRVAAAESKIAICWNDEFFAVDVPQPLPPEFKRGLSVRPEHRELTLTTAKDGLLKLPHKATGGTPPYSYTFVASVPGLEIDEQAGVVIVNANELQARAVELLGKSLIPIPSSPNPVEILDQFIGKSATATEKLIGRKLTGAPVFMPIHLRVQDADGQSTELRYGLIVEAPREPLQTVIKNSYDKLVAVQKEMRDRNAAGKVAPKGETTPATSGNAHQEELRRLREKVDVLESRMDLIIQKLDLLLKAQAARNSSTEPKKPASLPKPKSS